MLATLEADGLEHQTTISTEQEGNDWVKALRYCPAPLLDLVNSRACRGQIHSSFGHIFHSAWYTGAIMFNDPLDHHQCERLIQHLSETVFPFQCAHGRFVQGNCPQINVAI